MLTLDSPDAFRTFLEEHGAAVVYFGAADCAVCGVLKPKVSAMLEEAFPRMGAAFVEAPGQPTIAGQERVFTVPTVVVYFDGRELLRRVRNFSPAELAAELERPYRLYFEQ